MDKNAKMSMVFLLLILLLIAVLNTATGIFPQSVYGQEPNRYYLPLFYNQPVFPTSTSYYITTLNYGFIYNLGCDLGKRDQSLISTQDSVAVLAFGCPRCFEEGGFGANIFGRGPASLENISTVVKHFAAGYYICSGADEESNLIIGVGTSNYLCGIEPCETVRDAEAHGAAWSEMVREINQWLLSQGLFHQVQAFGANDMELGWNSPEWTRAWLAGFEQVSGNFMLHFGDAAGCPYVDRPHWSCKPPWTIEDVWYVSFGAPSALPLPLIYLTNGVHAKQWAYLSQYSVNKHGSRMDFTGVFTQWQACQQFGGCNYIDNTPNQAYQQLIDELGKSPDTTQYLRWKTDIRWILQNEIPQSVEAFTPIHDQTGVHLLNSRSQAYESSAERAVLSSILGPSLAYKQNTFQKMAEMAIISKTNPAPKDGSIPLPISRTTDLPFESGIIPNGEIPGRPYGVDITTVWQAITENGYLQIAGGTSPGDIQQGAVYVLQTGFDDSSFQSDMILAPQGCGPLTITSESDHSLFIESLNGCRFTFDLADWTLIPSTD